MFFKKSAEMPTTATALPGRDVPMPVEFAHAIYNRDLRAPDPEGFERLYVGMGCFWGAERKFWQLDGVYLTAVGYQAGMTKNPTYREVCTGMTGHNETVLIVFDPSKVSRATILKTFWESHDPTQGMRQGNDHGRSTVLGFIQPARSRRPRPSPPKKPLVRSSKRLALVPSPPKFSAHLSSSLPRITISNTCIRILAAIVALVARA